MQETQVQSLGREDSPGGGNGNPLQYSHLGNPTDRGAWWATVHGVVKSWTWLSMHKQVANNKQEGLAGCSFRPLSSVQSLSRVWLFATPGLQHARLPCPSPTPGACSNSCPSSWSCHPTISSSVVPFFFCLQSLLASGYFPMSDTFTSGGQSIGASASASVLPMNIQDWFSLGLTGLISLQSKGLSRVFSNTTVQKHQFFGAQLSFREGNGTPLQYSCLENPMDGGAW